MSQVSLSVNFQLGKRENHRMFNKIKRGKSRTLVEIAYKLMLGREPENDQVVKSKSHLSIESLRNEFIGSYEFQILNRSTLTPVFQKNGNDVLGDFSVNSHLERTISQWTSLGESNPYWSVISSEENRGVLDDRLKADFYASGVKNIDDFFQLLDFRNIEIINLNRVLELGCGVGRLTRTLAQRFESVTALDISPGNIQLAKNDLKNYKNVDFQILNSLDSIRSQEGEFDVFISLITLQHNPPEVQKAMLETIFSKLKKSGSIAYFQTVTHIVNQVPMKMRDDSDRENFDTYALPMHEILDLINKFDFKIFEIYRDDWQLDPNFHSYSFYLKC
jgi:2-polyprenyl-3-methyl-5-hydroxy-6-metoxy-1,4-benzoquinol methylase